MRVYVCMCVYACVCVLALTLYLEGSIHSPWTILLLNCSQLTSFIQHRTGKLVSYLTFVKLLCVLSCRL